MEQKTGLYTIIATIGIAVILFIWAGGAWFPRAQYESARALRLNAESLNVLSRAGAGAIRADTAQSWILPLALVALVALLVIRDRERQAQTRRLLLEMQRHALANQHQPACLPSVTYDLEPAPRRERIHTHIGRQAGNGR